MDYHVFKKPRIVKGKTVHRWYYYFIDPLSGKKVQKICKDCKTQADAYAFISALPSIYTQPKVTISTIAKYMYIPGSDHLNRMEKMGKSLYIKTLKDYRYLLDIFVSAFGDYELKNLSVPLIINFLLSAYGERSGSWKNTFLTVVGAVYEEAPFFGVTNVVKPTFPKFARNTKKKDILTTEELNRFFDETIWDTVNKKKHWKHNELAAGYEDMYLMFLCCASFGLRLGEAIGLQTKQFLFDYGMLVVDGFYRHETYERTNFNKKGSEDNQKIRIVPIPDVVATLMKDYIHKNRLQGDDFIFIRYGKPIDKKQADNWFQWVLEEAGIDCEGRNLTPHSLRFTYVTRMRRQESQETVQKLAGHTSAEMTDYYTRVVIPEMCEALQPARAAANRLFQ